jgi:hypothetical protein
MPTSKRVSTRRHSLTQSFQDAGGNPVKVTAHNAGGKCISTRGWSVQSLLKLGKGNFEEVERISVRKMAPRQIVEIARECDETGRPLILEDWHLRKEWNETILNVDYLVKQLPDQGRHSLLSDDVKPTVDL